MIKTPKVLSFAFIGATLLAFSGMANAQTLKRIELERYAVASGKSVNGQVELDSKAPSGGFVITLASDSAFATVPTTVTVASGQKSAQFAVTTTTVATPSTAVITGTDPNSKTAKAKIKVYSPYLQSLNFNPQSVVGGATTTGTLTLTGNAPAGGYTINLLSNEAYAPVPATVSIAEGSNTGTFTINTQAVTKTGYALVVATDPNGVYTKQALKVTAPIIVDVKELNISPERILSGTTGTGTIELNANAPTGGFTVNLTSSDSSTTVPATVTVPAGSNKANFTISTSTVTKSVYVTITATDPNNKSVKGMLSVYVLKIYGIMVSPGNANGGTTLTGAIALNGLAPAGGWTITLASNQTYVQVPATVTIPAGAAAVTFSITTSAVTQKGEAKITATDPNNVVVSTHVTIRP